MPVFGSFEANELEKFLVFALLPLNLGYSTLFLNELVPFVLTLSVISSWDKIRDVTPIELGKVVYIKFSGLRIGMDRPIEVLYLVFRPIAL